MALKGFCECDVVVFELFGPLREVIACHCTQCLKTLGNYRAATSVRGEDLKFHKSGGLTWHLSSGVARRGFCKGCESSLSYELDGQARISVGAGTLDGNTDLNIMRHIYIKNKPYNYDMPDTAPQLEDY